MDRQDWDERYAAVDLVWSAEPNRWVREEVTDLPAGRAADLAAGEGRNSIWMASRGWQVTAVDFSEVAADKGRRLAADLGGAAVGSIDWVVADLLDWEPPTPGFDLVLLCYLHLPAPERVEVLARAVAALAPGGTLLVIGHALRNLAEGTGGPRDPGVLYDPDDVLAELPGGGGLTVERAELVRRPVEGVRDAIDTLVRARRPR